MRHSLAFFFAPILFSVPAIAESPHSLNIVRSAAHRRIVEREKKQASNSNYVEVVGVRETAEKKSSQLCTAIVVAKNVVLTAAHCLPSTKTIEIPFKGSPSGKAKCTPHPKFRRGNDEHDIAACILEKEAPNRHACIGKAAEAGEEVRLIGHGHINLFPNLNLRLSGSQRSGLSKIAKAGALLQTTRTGVGAAAGDSGGFMGYVSADAKDPNPVKVQAVIVSTTMVTEKNEVDTDGRTFGVSLDAKDVREFLTKFEDDNKVSICGLRRFTRGG